MATLDQIDELRDRITKLPVWAREYINRLLNLQEQLVNEAVRARQNLTKSEERCRRLFDANEAMSELFRRAADGGSDYAKAIVKVLEGYEIFPKGKEISSGPNS